MKRTILLFAFMWSLTTIAQVGAVWTNPTSGTIDGVAFTITGITDSSIANYDLSTADFSGAPLSASQACLDYDGNNSFTITLASPIALYVYAKYWRTDTYVFSDNVTLLSGSNLTMANATTVDAIGFADGVFQVQNQVTSFTITSTLQGCCSNQAMNFGGIANVGLNENTIPNISLYPNPTNDGIMFINYDGQINAIEVMDMTGRKVSSSVVIENNKIDASKLSMGNYMIHIFTNEGVVVKEVSIVR